MHAPPPPPPSGHARPLNVFFWLSRKCRYILWTPRVCLGLGLGLFHARGIVRVEYGVEWKQREIKERLAPFK